MPRLLTTLTILCGVAWLQSATVCLAQNGYRMNAPSYTSPTVSPYVNLGVNSNGISNYQTLVRPMLDEREELIRQGANIQQLQQFQQMQQRGMTPATRELRDPRFNNVNERSQPGVKFMHYSHFYGGLR